MTPYSVSPPDGARNKQRDESGTQHQRDVGHFSRFARALQHKELSEIFRSVTTPCP